MKESLKYASDNAQSLQIDNMNEESLDRYHFLSVLRHPIERALAGIHQVEVFWMMNWIDPVIDDTQLT